MPNQRINLKFTAYSENLNQNFENFFFELNRMNFITNKQMYNDALKLFHVEIKQVQKGHLVFVTDGNGTPIRHPIKMSDIEERPRFYPVMGKCEKVEQDVNYSIDNLYNIKANFQNNSRMLVDLLRLIPNSSNKNRFRKKNS